MRGLEGQTIPPTVQSTGEMCFGPFPTDKPQAQNEWFAERSSRSLSISPSEYLDSLYRPEERVAVTNAKYDAGFIYKPGNADSAGLAIDPNAAGPLALRGNAEDYLRRFEQAKSMRDGVKIATRLEGVARLGAICPSEQA